MDCSTTFLWLIYQQKDEFTSWQPEFTKDTKHSISKKFKIVEVEFVFTKNGYIINIVGIYCNLLGDKHSLKTNCDLYGLLYGSIDLLLHFTKMKCDSWT